MFLDVCSDSNGSLTLIEQIDRTHVDDQDVKKEESIIIDMNTCRRKLEAGPQLAVIYHSTPLFR
jgi:hypothetical protein